MWRSTGPFVGLDNYTAVLGDSEVHQAFRNVAVFLVINVPLTVILSLVLATALNGAIRGRVFFRVSYFVPYISASVAVVAVWLFLFSNGGFVNQLLGPLAPDPSWLINKTLAMPLIAVFVTWKQLGFFILLYLAALQNVGKELYESASMDGAGKFGSFMNITVPGVRAATTLVVILSDHHRRQPVHRALPADQRRRSQRRLGLAGAADVPARHRAGEPRHRRRDRRAPDDRGPDHRLRRQALPGEGLR